MRDNGWRRITAKERTEAAKFIEHLPNTTPKEIRTKAILSYFVCDNLSASAISRLNDPRIVGIGNRSNGNPLSATSILQIIYNHFPQFKGRTGQKDNSLRVELIKRRQKQESPHLRQCAFCGALSDLEEHHMIPLSLGGTNDDRNLVFLCREHHRQVTAYQEALRRGG